MDSLHLICILLQVLTCLLIILSRNPIHSILFLILLFFESSIILILFHIEFLSLLLILIYVGAIAILFLFVVMMLQVKTEPFNFVFFVILSFMSFIVFLIEIDSYLSIHFFLFKSFQGSAQYVSSLDSLTDIETLGQSLFNYYPTLFLIAGLLLLVALLGSVVLTIDLNRSNQSNVIFRRLSRTDNTFSWFK